MWGRLFLQWLGAQGMLTEEAWETVAQGPGQARPWHGTLRGTGLPTLTPPQLQLLHLCHQESQRLTRGQPRLLNNSATSVGWICKQLFTPLFPPLSVSRPVCWDLWWGKCQPKETGTHQRFIPGRYINAVMVSWRKKRKRQRLAERDKWQSLKLLRM